MLIQQISVFIENRPGSLEGVTDALARAQVDIIALSLADTSEFGILRLIVDRPDAAQTALREAGHVAKSTDVLAVAMDDRPGGLAGVMRLISKAGLSIEYMYAFVGKQDGKAVVVMRVNDPEGAMTALNKDGTTIVTARDIYNL